MSLPKPDESSIPPEMFAAFLEEPLIEEASNEPDDFCALDALSLSRLSRVSVACWRLAGQISAHQLVHVAGSLAFLATEFEDRRFKADLATDIKLDQLD